MSNNEKITAKCMSVSVESQTIMWTRTNSAIWKGYRPKALKKQSMRLSEGVANESDLRKENKFE